MTVFAMDDVSGSYVFVGSPQEIQEAMEQAYLTDPTYKKIMDAAYQHAKLQERVDKVKTYAKKVLGLKDMQDWMNSSRRVYEVIGEWNDSNLLARTRPVNYMKSVLISARQIPSKLVDENLRVKISILEKAVKIVEDKDKEMKNLRL